MKLKTQLILFAFLLIALSPLQACSQSDEVKIKMAADKFHKLLKARQFQEIYKEASPRLRAKIKEEDFVAKLKSDVSKLGEISEIKSNDFFPLPSPITEESKDFKHASSIFSIKGKKAEIFEVLVWDMEANDPKLAIYSTDYAAAPVSQPINIQYFLRLKLLFGNTVVQF